jgi:hypothetical protein
MLECMRGDAFRLLEVAGEFTALNFSEAQEASLIGLLRCASDTQQSALLRHLSRSSNPATLRLFRSTIASIAAHGPRPADSVFLARFLDKAHHCDNMIDLQQRASLPSLEYLRPSPLQFDDLVRPAGIGDQQADEATTLLRPGHERDDQ